MAEITASMVKELRERTGSGMMECKKALAETNGDLEAAIEFLRKSGQAKALKKATRIAAEGLVVTKISADKKHGVMLEINCETDFVAKDSNFLEFTQKVAAAGLQHKVADLAAFAQVKLENGQTIDETRNALIAKLGENINIRRMRVLNVEAGEVSEYLHHGGKIGVLVALQGGDQALARDIAMHIAAENPVVIYPDQVPEALVAKEREIALAQEESSGKPAHILEKILEGRIKKFVNELSLVGQPFVKDPKKSVGQLLSTNQKILDFARFHVGEGIEKQEEDFVQAVMSQVRGD